MPVWLQVIFSVLLIVVVLWFVWKLPRRGEALAGWAPWLALASAWIGLAAAACSALTWFVPNSDPFLAILFMALVPGALTSGLLALWIQRGQPNIDAPIAAQRTQALVGITLALLAIALGYAFVFAHRSPDPIF